MLALLQLLLPKRAAKQRVAVLIQSVGEVLARHANPCSPEGGESLLVYPGPFPASPVRRKRREHFLQTAKKVGVFPKHPRVRRIAPLAPKRKQPENDARDGNTTSP